MRREVFAAAAACAWLVATGCRSRDSNALYDRNPVAETSREVRDAVKQFRRANPGWNALWRRGSGTPRLTGRGLPLPGPDDLESMDRDGMAAKLAAVISAHRQQLGLGNLDVRFVSGSRAGHVWFLRGALQRGAMPVGGRVDCGVTTSNRVVLMSAHVPPDVEQLVDTTHRDKSEAESAVAISTGLQGSQESVRVGARPSQVVIWWNADAASPPPPRLAWRVFVEPKPGADSVGGTYWLDANSLQRLQFAPGKHGIGAPGAGERTAAVPSNAALHERARASRADVKIQVRARVRTGAGALGATTLEPVPLLCLEWAAGAGKKDVWTDIDGYLTLAAGPGDTLTTKFRGLLLSAVLPEQTFTAAVPPANADGSPSTWDIEDVGGATALLENATVYHWVAKGNLEMAKVFVPSGLTGIVNPIPFADIGLLGCSVGSATTCDAEFLEPSWIDFGGKAGGCESFAFDTIILHEWAHALDHVCGGIHDDALKEAFADIVAMFLTRQPLIGEGYDGYGALRTGNASVRAGDPVLAHGHPGQPLMCFAWHVRDELIARSATGEEWAKSLFLGQVGGDPPDIAEFVRRVFLANDDDADLSTPATNDDVLRNWCIAHGLGGCLPSS